MLGYYQTENAIGGIFVNILPCIQWLHLQEPQYHENKSLYAAGAYNTDDAKLYLPSQTDMESTTALISSKFMICFALKQSIKMPILSMHGNF